MREGVPYAGLELEFYEECFRTVPAVAKLRAEGRFHDVHALLSGVHRSAAEHKISPGVAWGILCTAYMVWVQQLFTAAAKKEDRDVLDLLGQAIGMATDWSASER